MSKEWNKHSQQSSIICKGSEVKKILIHLRIKKKEKAVWLHNMENEEREGYQIRREKSAGARSGKAMLVLMFEVLSLSHWESLGLHL